MVPFTRRRRRRLAGRRAPVATALVLAAVLAPASARASTLSVENGTVVFRAAPGEANRATVGVNPFVGDQNRYTAADSGGTLTAGPGCEAEEFYGTIVCQMPGPAPVLADVGDGNDSLGLSVPGTALGGPGDDQLLGRPVAQQRFEGGPGNDTINADDTGYCTAGGSPRGPDSISGGDGVDIASYDADVGPVSVTIGNGADDGASGEGDDVQGDVESVIGTDCARNVLTGTDGPNSLDGAGTLNGLGGDDVLEGSGQDDVLSGGEGNDRLRAFTGNDTLDGGGGDDFLEGGFDDDKLTGGPGTDSFVGDETASNTIGTGNDTILAADGLKENVSCGPGSDVAELDQLDVVPVDTQNLCETVRRSGATTPPPGGGGPTPPGGPTASPLALVGKVPRLATALRSGLKARVTCPAACSVTLRATLTKATAKRYRVSTTVVRAKRTRLSAGAVTVTLKASKRTRGRLARAKTLKVTLVASITGADKKTRTVRKVVTLKR